MDIERLNNLSDEYEELSSLKKISKYNSPINMVEERNIFIDSFLSGHEYNPQFIYHSPPDSWEVPLMKFKNKLSQNSYWKKLLYDDVLQSILEMQAIRKHSPDKITSQTIWVHGVPGEELINEAFKILNQSNHLSEEKANILPIEAANILEKALREVGLVDWEVTITSEMNAKMMVKSSEKSVYIREDCKFSQDSIKRLLVHEIGTHVFRYINGENQPFRFLRLGLIGYLPTEEGLATYHESKFGVLDIETLRKYAIRVLAAHLSLNNSFFNVYKELLKYTDNMEDLFDIVKRAKRGFIDTSHWGAHVKDQVYLKGFLLVTRYLSNFESNYQFILTGKVSIEMIPVLQSLLEKKVVSLNGLSPNNLQSIREG